MIIQAFSLKSHSKYHKAFANLTVRSQELGSAMAAAWCTVNEWQTNSMMYHLYSDLLGLGALVKSCATTSKKETFI